MNERSPWSQDSLLQFYCARCTSDGGGGAVVLVVAAAEIEFVDDCNRCIQMGLHRIT